jgi:hypothetical protein
MANTDPDPNEGNPFEPPETAEERHRRIRAMIRDNVDARLKPIPVAVQRLMEEVRLGDATSHGLFDRWHNRHNR